MTVGVNLLVRSRVRVLLLLNHGRKQSFAVVEVMLKGFVGPADEWSGGMGEGAVRVSERGVQCEGPSTYRELMYGTKRERHTLTN